MRCLAHCAKQKRYAAFEERRPDPDASRSRKASPVGLAVTRCLKARKQVVAFALIVDSKDASAKASYEHYGFTS